MILLFVCILVSVVMFFGLMFLIIGFMVFKLIKYINYSVKNVKIKLMLGLVVIIVMCCKMGLLLNVLFFNLGGMLLICLLSMCMYLFNGIIVMIYFVFDLFVLCYIGFLKLIEKCFICILYL